MKCHPKMHIHIAHIRPDVNPGMNGLLKEQPGSQLFTVFGRPRTAVKGPDGDGMYTVEMEGVDVYDPVNNTIVDTGAAKVAAWFVDGDYDGRTFCITQAFFPDRSAWEKLSKALASVVDPERFELFSGTVSLPFPAEQAQKRRSESDRPLAATRVMQVWHALAGDEEVGEWLARAEALCQCRVNCRCSRRTGQSSAIPTKSRATIGSTTGRLERRAAPELAARRATGTRRSAPAARN